MNTGIIFVLLTGLRFGLGMPFLAHPPQNFVTEFDLSSHWSFSVGYTLTNFDLSLKGLGMGQYDSLVIVGDTTSGGLIFSINYRFRDRNKLMSPIISLDTRLINSTAKASVATGYGTNYGDIYSRTFAARIDLGLDFSRRYKKIPVGIRFTTRIMEFDRTHYTGKDWTGLFNIDFVRKRLTLYPFSGSRSVGAMWLYVGIP